jgi:hypothetical protein
VSGAEYRLDRIKRSSGSSLRWSMSGYEGLASAESGSECSGSAPEGAKDARADRDSNQSVAMFLDPLERFPKEEL